MQLALAVALGCFADGVSARAATEIAGYSDTNHVEVFTPSVAGHVEDSTAGWSLDAHYLLDIISAASPDIISTASQRWTEVRQAGDVRAAYKPGNFGASVNGGVSNEPDYRSLAFGASVTADLDEKNITLLAGYGYAHDTIGRTGTPFSVFSHDLARHALTASASFIVDRRTVVALIADGGIELGDSSKPYRYIPLFAPNVAPAIPAGATLDIVTAARLPGRVREQRPLVRDRLGLTARLAHRWDGLTTRFEARLYDDTWDIAAFSTDGRALFDLGQHWAVGPHVKYYVQSAASFWKLAYVGTASDVPAYRVGDRELGPLMNLTGGGLLRWSPSLRWSFSLHGDVTYARYLRDLYITHLVSALEGVTAEASW